MHRFRRCFGQPPHCGKQAWLTPPHLPRIQPHQATSFFSIPDMKPEPTNLFVIFELGALALATGVFLSYITNLFSIGTKGSIAAAIIGIAIVVSVVLYLHPYGAI